ncbi:hypothetical protein [Actinoallomurus soli]|uniref:hypothetical protein n=1 Tax=Actinoallomurus soli TaxID=2952535 RepID=UPI002092247A|nr:hypothetical protein [Actinoallomurus soli]MCO5973348.1 hypothetical protein [Actinoallomurus soli]
MPWKIREGEVLPRQEIHRRCGGQRQRGISISNESSAVLLFSTIKGRKLYGLDHPLGDGGYQYTGDGQVGDQTFNSSSNNAALRDHRLAGRTVHLFEEAIPSKHCYLGEYVVDERDPFRYEDAPDVNKDMRQVIVFRLWRVSDARLYDDERYDQVTIEDVDLEAHNADRFRVNRAKPITEAERRESMLVQRYAAWLSERGHISRQRRISLPDRAFPLKTDLFDVTANELVEAKGSASRGDIRMAIGQILDYGRHAQVRRRAILLPTRPTQDMVELLGGLGITCIFEEEEEGSFKRIDAAARLCGACPLMQRESGLP